MTVSSQTNKETFTGNGVTTVWDLPFRFFHNDEVFVYLVDPVSLTTTPLLLGTDYTLTGEGLPEQFGTAPGKITTTVPVANLKQLYVERVMPIEQLTDIINQGQFFPEVHEDVFDRLTMLIQQADANSRGAIRVAIGDPEPARLPAAPLRANLLMGFDGLGNPMPVSPSADSSAALALMLANEALITQGAAMIGRGGQVVKSIVELKTLLKNTPSKNAFVTGYYAPGDGGGGPYWLDSTDTTSADNGGTVIVAADGGRWKLSHTGTLSVLQFGADPTGTNDSAPAFKAIRDYFQTVGDFRGGKIHVPKGYFKMLDAWIFTAAAAVVHNITIVGDGILCTTLDFTGAPANTDGIGFVGAGAHVVINGLMVKGARRNGISFATCHEISVQEVRVQNCLNHGIHFDDTFMCSLSDIWSTTNGGNGVNFQQKHTSVTGYRVYTNDNTGIGMAINGMTYSAFMACGSDNNTKGYSISNVRGLTFLSCGAEANHTDAWYVFSSNASQGTLPIEFRYVNGLELIGCVGYFNSAGNPGVFGNFISVVANDANPIQFSMKGCGSARANVADFAVVISATGGPVIYRDDDPAHDGKYSLVGGASLTPAGFRESIIPSGSSVALTTNVGKTVTSITLPAGDWAVDGTVLYTPQGSTVVAGYYSGISTVNNTLPGEQDYMTGPARAAAAATFNIRSPAVKIRSDGTTVVYLIAQAGFSSGTLVAAGKLSARKI